MLRSKKDIKEQILALVEEYYESAFKQNNFIPGKDVIRIGGRVFGAEELKNLVNSSLDFWLTEGGPYSRKFSDEFSSLLKRKYTILTNSGSSANLLALSSLRSANFKEQRLKPGDEVITVASAFPTTVNPIIQNELVPVFVDITMGTYNVNVEHIRKALSPKTRGIILAHTLGNPFDVDSVLEIVKEHNLFLVEDACDALDSAYKGEPIGSFGDMATFSFYPAHHITMGEGGAVVTDNESLMKSIVSIKNWGRDCSCPPGEDNICKMRFNQKFEHLPPGYDHKYTITHVGYNLKLLDLQAAIGLAQLERLKNFTKARQDNFAYLYENLKCYENYFYLPKSTPGSEPSWFGFMLTLRPDCPFKRIEIIQYLENQKIMTRMLFTGNILRHPAYREIRHRVASSLEITNYTMENSFWVGIFPGLNKPMLDCIIDAFHKFFSKHKLSADKNKFRLNAA